MFLQHFVEDQYCFPVEPTGSYLISHKLFSVKKGFFFFFFFWFFLPRNHGSISFTDFKTDFYLSRWQDYAE